MVVQVKTFLIWGCDIKRKPYIILLCKDPEVIRVRGGSKTIIYSLDVELKRLKYFSNYRKWLKVSGQDETWDLIGPFETREEAQAIATILEGV